MKVDRVGNMVAIERVLARRWIRDQAALESIGECLLSPTSSYVVLRACTDERRAIGVAVKIHLDFALAPPAGILRVHDYAYMRSDEAPLAADSWKNLEVVRQRRPPFPPPSGMEVK